MVEWGGSWGLQDGGEGLRGWLGKRLGLVDPVRASREDGGKQLETSRRRGKDGEC